MRSGIHDGRAIVAAVVDPRTLARLLPLFAIGGAVVPTVASAATPAPLARAVSAWTTSHPETGISVLRLDATGPTPIVNYKADIARRPASTMKIVTAAAAMMAFGPDHRFVTTLATPSAPILGGSHLQSKIYLTGAGDPMLATPGYISRYLTGGVGTNIDRLAKQLRTAGFTTVTGRIVVDEGRFDTRRRVASWPAHYVIECRPLSAVNVNQGYRGDLRTTYVTNPPLSAGTRLKAALKRAGIAHTGRVVTGTRPPGSTVIATVRSPALRRIAGVMLPQSDNYIAETLTKNTGAEVLGTGTTAAGTAAARTLLARWIGPRNTLVDGSGLDRSNRMTPRSMARLLAAAGADPTWGSALIDGLPTGGEGTLEKRFLASSLRTRVHAKTGYIAATSTLAGIVESPAGVRYAFAIYMNDLAITDAKRAQDRIVTLLARGVADGA